MIGLLIAGLGGAVFWCVFSIVQLNRSLRPEGPSQEWLRLRRFCEDLLPYIDHQRGCLRREGRTKAECTCGLNRISGDFLGGK